MPAFRKLSEAETAALEQSATDTDHKMAREYDECLAGFAAGDYGRVELHASEQRAAVRTLLQAAAKRRGLQLRFRPGRGPLTFYVMPDSAAESVASAPSEVAPSASPAPARDEQLLERQPPQSTRPPRRRVSAAERYREVLPRWMRDGNQPGRRGDNKRRPR